jgi:hypothetical protein
MFKLPYSVLDRGNTAKSLWISGLQFEGFGEQQLSPVSKAYPDMDNDVEPSLPTEPGTKDI